MTLKTIVLAAAASVALVSAASANNALPFNNTIEGTSVDLGHVTTSDAGVVSLYDYHRGVKGALLGTEQVAAGANFNVKLKLNHPVINDVLAVLTVNGQIVDTQKLDVVR
jgi:hypothetical protein